MGGHPLEEVEPVTIRQAHVREAQVEALRFEQLLRRGDVAGRLRRELHARQRERDQLDQIGLVVDYEYQR